MHEPTSTPVCPPAPRRRPWFAFRLRTLMLAVLVVGVALGWEVERVASQRRAVATIRAAGGQVTYDYDYDRNLHEPPRYHRPLAPERLRRRLGVDFFHDVIAVDLHDWSQPGNHRFPTPRVRITDDVIEAIHGLRALRSLSLGDSDLNDGQLARIGPLPRLERLYLHRSKITDAGLAYLRSFPALECLRLEDTNIGDAGLVHLRSLARLENLNLAGTRVGDPGMASLAGLSNLSLLQLDRTTMGDAGVFHLRGLPRLTALSLRDTRVGDAGVDALLSHRNLFYLNLRGTRLSPEGEVRIIREIHPRNFFMNYHSYQM